MSRSSAARAVRTVSWKAIASSSGYLSQPRRVIFNEFRWIGARGCSSTVDSPSSIIKAGGGNQTPNLSTNQISNCDVLPGTSCRRVSCRTDYPDIISTSSPQWEFPVGMYCTSIRGYRHHPESSRVYELTSRHIVEPSIRGYWYEIERESATSSATPTRPHLYPCDKSPQHDSSLLGLAGGAAQFRTMRARHQFRLRWTRGMGPKLPWHLYVRRGAYTLPMWLPSRSPEFLQLQLRQRARRSVLEPSR